MDNFEGYLMNIVYGLFLLAGYTYCGIVPTFLGFIIFPQKTPASAGGEMNASC